MTLSSRAAMSFALVLVPDLLFAGPGPRLASRRWAIRSFVVDSRGAAQPGRDLPLLVSRGSTIRGGLDEPQ
jgi:hypothetical protein